jgi:hypothetical protein
MNLEELSIKENIDFIEIASEIADMLIKKNADYGDENLTKHGMTGIIVRLSDKLARLENLQGKKGHIDETTEDTLKDIAGYAINALRLRREGKI